jgi:hypothetical protein
MLRPGHAGSTRTAARTDKQQDASERLPYGHGVRLHRYFFPKIAPVSLFFQEISIGYIATTAKKLLLELKH